MSANHLEMGMNVVRGDGSSTFEAWEHDALDERMGDVIAAVGGVAALAALPVLDLGEGTGRTGYLDFISPEMMSAPVMRGVDSVGRPFIALRFEVEGYFEGETVVEVEVLHRRYTTGSVWTSGGASRICSGAMAGELLEFLSRLVKGERCGVRYSRSLSMWAKEGEELEKAEVAVVATEQIVGERGGRNVKFRPGSFMRADGTSVDTSQMSWEAGEIKLV